MDYDSRLELTVVDGSIVQDNGSSDHDDNITVTFKAPPPLNIEIDIDQLTIDDLEFVEKLSADEVPLTEIVSFLKRVLPDGYKLPLRAVPKLTDAVISAIGGASDPNA